MERNRRLSRQARHRRIRSRLAGTAVRPRLAVFRSIRHIEAQLIDDAAGRTLVAARDGAKLKPAEAEGRSRGLAVAWAVGQELASLAREKGITDVVFDRAGYRYHGRVKALADGAREGGLVF